MYGQLPGDAFGGMNQQRFGGGGFPQELLGGGFGAPTAGLPQQNRGFGGLPPQQGLPRGPGGFGLPQQQAPQSGGFGGFGAPPPMQQHLQMPGMDAFNFGGAGFGVPPQQSQRMQGQQKGGGGGFGGGGFGQQKGGGGPGMGGPAQQRPQQQQRSGGGGGCGNFQQQRMPLPGGQPNFKGGKDMGGFGKGEKGPGGGGGGKGKRQFDNKGGAGGFPQQQQQQIRPPPVPGVNPNGTANWSYGQSAKADPFLEGMKGMKGDGMKGMKGAKGMPMMPFGKGGESLDVHSNVFVGNLQEGTTQSQVESAFSAFGPIQSCTIATKEGRTYGFVKFAAIDSATRAIAALGGQNGWVVKMANKDAAGGDFGKGGFGKGGGKGATSSTSKPTHTNVFVGSLKDGLTNAQLEKVFKSYGTVDSCVVMDKEDKTYGFVEFSTIAEAQAAVEGMNGQEGLVVKFSNNDNVPMSWEDSIPHSNVFIGSLPTDMTEGKLRGICERHGSVQSCSLRADSDAEKSFGFVKFTTIAAARRAIKALNGTDGWSVKCANHDVAGAGGKGDFDGKGMFGGKGAFPGLWPFGKGGKGGGWVWTNNQPENDRPEPEPHDNLYIKNLPPGINDEEVIKTFATEGDVVECRVLNWDGVSECAALVRMATVAQATAAKAKYNETVHEKCQQTLSVALQQKSGSSVEDHIYVKGLHCTTTPEQLKEVFSQVGEIKWSRILPMPFWPTPGKLAEGTALVQYSTPAEAEAAVAKFDGTVNDGVGLKMSVRYAEEKVSEKPEAKPNSNVYVKGWPVGFPDFLLQSVFQKYGQVMRLRLLDNPDPEQPTQAALVQMGNEAEATAALKALHGHVAELPVPAMRVKPAGRDGTPSANLYVSSLPRTITEQQIRESFKKFGEIVRLKLLNQEKSPELRALVELSSLELAQQAVRALDNTAPVFTGPMLYIQYASKREGGKGEKGGRKGE